MWLSPIKLMGISAVGLVVWLMVCFVGFQMESRNNLLSGILFTVGAIGFAASGIGFVAGIGWMLVRAFSKAR